LAATELGLRVYDARAGAELAQARAEEVYSREFVARSPDESLLATGGADGEIHVWQPPTKGG
jgi:hypothetical protein